MSRNTIAKKPYCKVCHDAGKPESEYTNHWVRTLPDRTGKTKVTCPTLLSNECRYCFKLGHTAKFCPVIEKNKKNKERAERQEARKKEEELQKAKIEKLKPEKRGFAVLDVDTSDSEADEIKVSIKTNQIIEEFPALDTKPKTQIEVNLPSVKADWAAVAAKPKMVPVQEDSFVADLEHRSMIKNLPQSALKAQVVKSNPVERDMTKKIYTTNWADWSDSDDEEEEELQKVPPMPYKFESMAPGWSTQVAADDDDW